MAYRFIPDPTYARGRFQAISRIVIHWWNTPQLAGNLSQTVNYLLGVEESIHYVVSGDDIVQMVREEDTAWHARSANPFSIGIEVDPKLPGNTYATAENLVAQISKRYGFDPRLAVKPHSTYVATSCPGVVDWQRIAHNAYNIMIRGEQPVANFYETDLSQADATAWYKNYGNMDLGPFRKPRDILIHIGDFWELRARGESAAKASELAAAAVDKANAIAEQAAKFETQKTEAQKLLDDGGGVFRRFLRYIGINITG